MKRNEVVGEPYLGHEKPKCFVEEHLISGLLPKRGVLIIVGEPGKGKSLLSIHLAKCLATKEQIFCFEGEEHESGYGCSVEKRGSIFLPGEAYNTLHSRLTASAISIPEPNRDPFFYDSLPVAHIYARSLSSQEKLDELKEKVGQQVETLSMLGMPPAVIAVDTISSVFAFTNENDAGEAQAALDMLYQLADQHDCLIVLVAHCSKGQFAKGWEVRGSGVWNGAADVVWMVKQTKGVVSVKVVKGRDGYAEGTTFYLEIVPSQGSAYLRPIPASSASVVKQPKPKPPILRDHVLQTIADNAFEHSCYGEEQIIESLRARGLDVTRSGTKRIYFKREVKRALQELTESKRIIHNEFNGTVAYSMVLKSA